MTEASLAMAVDAVATAMAPELGETPTAFFRSVYAHGLDRYRTRMAALGLEQGGMLLDAGCGFGQWSLAVAGGYRQIVGIDVSPARVAACRRLAHEAGVGNCVFERASLEAMPLAGGAFDAAISYSVLYATDYMRAIYELGRVIRPGGTLYLSTNGAGRYVADIVENRYANKDFNTRRAALFTLGRTAMEALGNSRRWSGTTVFMPVSRTLRLLRRAGFEIVEVGPEGSLGKGDTPWLPGRYAGLVATYDVLARRR